MRISDLFDNILEFRAFAPGVSLQDELTELESMMPYVRKQIVAYIPGLWDEIVSDKSAPAYTALRVAVANLILYKHVTFLVVSNRTAERDIYKYEAEQMRREYLDNYYCAMDDLLSRVSSEARYATRWGMTEVARSLAMLRIANTEQFDRLYPIDSSYLFFFRTVPFQREVYAGMSTLYARLKIAEDEHPETDDYPHLYEQLDLAIVKRVVALALERFDITALPLTMRNLFDEQKAARNGADERNAAIALARRLRQEADEAVGMVDNVITMLGNMADLSSSAYDESDKILFIP